MGLAIRYTTLNRLGDYLLSWTALGQFLLLVIQTFLIDSGICSEEVAGVLRVIGSAILVVASFCWILKRSAILLLVVYVLLIILFTSSIILDVDNMEYVVSEGVRITACTVVPVFLSFVSIYNMDIFRRAALHVSLFTAFFGILYMLFSLTGRLPEKETYNMGFGYSLLFPAMFLLFSRRFIFTLIAILLFCIIFLEGSRGPLVPIILFFVLQKMMLGTVRGKLALGLLVLLILLSFIALLPSIVGWLDSIGLQSRTLNLLVAGEIVQDTGRGLIYDAIVEKIWMQPFGGYGVFGDRQFLNGVYCHNFFLELAIDFGIFAPALVLLVLLVLFLYMLPKLAKDELIFFLLLVLALIFSFCVISFYLVYFRIFLFGGYFYRLYHKYGKRKKVYSTCA